jgi:hypothetical protein
MTPERSSDIPVPRIATFPATALEDRACGDADLAIGEHDRILSSPTLTRSGFRV